MPFIAGGFSHMRKSQKSNIITKSEENLDCETATSEFEVKAKNELDQIVDISDCQTKLQEDDVLKDNSNDQNSVGQNETSGKLRSDEKIKMLCCNLDHAKKYIWNITNFFQLPTDKDYCIDSEEFSVANATWCLRVYPNGKKGYNTGCIHLLLVRLKSCNPEHQIHYRFGIKTSNDQKQKSSIHSVTYHADAEEMGFVNLTAGLNVFNRKKLFAKADILTVICEIFMIEEVTDPLSNSIKYNPILFKQVSETESLKTPTKASTSSPESAFTNPVIYMWKIKNFLDLPMDEGFFMDSAEFSVANATWCLRMYPNGQKGHNKEWIHLFLVRVCSHSEPRVYYTLGLKKPFNNECETFIHDATFLTNGMKMGIVYLLRRTEIIHKRRRRMYLVNGTLTAFCHLYMAKENDIMLSNSTLSTNQYELPSKFQPVVSERNFQKLCPQTVLSIQDSFTWEITNFSEFPMNESYFMDSREFSFANATWCLRIYPNGKKGDHGGWVLLFLVRLNSFISKHRIHYRIGLKIQDNDLHETFTHVVTFYASASEIGIVNPLKRSDVIKRMKKCTQNDFLKVFCEIVLKEEIEISNCTDVPESSSKFQTVALSQHLPSAVSEKNIFIWKIPDFCKLPMNEDYFTDSEKFTIANGVWCLRMYPNRQNGEKYGWIHLLLVRLQSSSLQHCIQYRLGLKIRDNAEYGTLAHMVTFCANAEEMGVVNLYKRSDASKKFIQNGILTVFCEILMIEDTAVEITDKTVQLKPLPEMQSDKKLCCCSDHSKECYWKIKNFFQLPTNQGYCINSEQFSVANASWCLRLYPNGRKGVNNGWMHLLLVRLKSYNSLHKIHYKFGIKTCSGRKQENFFHAVTFHTDAEEMGLINLIKRSDISQKKRLAPKDVLTVFCEILMIEEITISLSESPILCNPLSDIQSLEKSRKAEELCLSSALSDRKIYVWEINDFLGLPMKEGYFIDSAEFSFANATWCMRMYPNGKVGRKRGWIQLFLVRVSSSKSKHRIHFRLGFEKINNEENETVIHDVIFHANNEKLGIINLLKRSTAHRKRSEVLKSGALTVFCCIYMVEEFPDVSNSPPSENLFQSSSKSLPIKKLENLRFGMLEKQLFVDAKDVIWKIPSLFFVPMNVGQWMDSPVFSFLNEIWCLRIYMKERIFGKDRKICVHLVKFNSCSLVTFTTYQFSIMNNCGKWLKSQKRNCQHMCENNVMKLGICQLYFSPDGFVTLYFQMLLREAVTEAETSMLTGKPRFGVEFPLNYMELYEPSQFQYGVVYEQSFLAVAEVTWKIPDFFELRKEVDDSVNSPIFDFSNGTWLLQFYPNGQGGTPGKISFVLIRLHSSTLKQHIISYFSIKNSINITSCKLEYVFEGESTKSHPVHIELSPVMNKLKKKVSNGVLTVFCQVYIIKECVEAKHLEPVTDDPLNTLNPIGCGLLFQQTFVAVTKITWKIPDILTLEKEDCYYINSPAFNLANDTWLLQLYPKGYETSTGKISLVLVRLFPSNINHHVICKFKLKNTNSVSSDKGSCANIFKDKVIKSSPVHLIKFMEKQEENDQDLLTVFCQMYIKDNIEGALETSSEITQPTQMTVFPLSNMEQYKRGVLIQQSFLAATEVIWRIPDFFKLGMTKDYIINSPMFGLANDTWLLQLYPKGCEKSVGKISCILVRLFPSAECHVICKFSIKNKYDILIETAFCESTFKDKVLKSHPVHLRQPKFMDKVEENVPEGILTLFCQMYIIDDKREATTDACLQMNHPVPVTNKDLCVDDVNDLKENKSNASLSEGLNKSSQDMVSKGEVNNLTDGKGCDEIDSTLVKQKKKRSLSEIIKLKRDKMKKEIVSKTEAITVADGKDFDEIDFTNLKKKKKKKNISIDQLEEMISKAEVNTLADGKDFDDIDFTNIKKKKKNISIDELEKKVVRDDRNAVESDGNVADVTVADLNIIKEEKIMSNNQSDVECHSEEKKDVAILGKAQQDSRKVPLCEEYDIRFFVKGEEIRAHSSVFKDQTNFFTSLVQHDIVKTSSLVVIDDSDPQIFKVFLHYLYTEHKDAFNSENVFGLYLIANKYDIQKLKTECLQYMRDTITVDNFCDMPFLLQQKEMEIVELATDFFSKNATEITSSSKWQKFLKENYIFANKLLLTMSKM